MAHSALIRQLSSLKAATGDLAIIGCIPFYFSNNSDGSSLSVTSTDVTSLAIGTDGLIVPISENVSGFLVSESDGDIDLAIEIPSGKTVYLVLVMPDGRLVISGAITYAE
jgi:hypothetical protein